MDMDILVIIFGIFMAILSICVAFAIIGINKRMQELNRLVSYSLFPYPYGEFTEVEENVLNHLYENAPKGCTEKQIIDALAWYYGDGKRVTQALQSLVDKKCISKQGNQYRLYQK